MKEEIEISNRTKYVLFGSYLMVIVFAIIYFTNNWLDQQKKMDNFKKSIINARILVLKDLQRGNYLIELKVGNTIKAFSLPIAYEIKRDNIQVGDSLSKQNDTDKFEIFRTDMLGRTVKVSEIILYENKKKLIQVCQKFGQ